MSAFHNSTEGEKLALKFHAICAGVGVLHVALGIGIILWHLNGMNDHRKNLEKMNVS